MISTAPEALVTFIEHDADFYLTIFYGTNARKHIKEDSYWLDRLPDLEDLRDYLIAIENALNDAEVRQRMFLTEAQLALMGKIKMTRMQVKVLVNELKQKGGFSDHRQALRDIFLADFGPFVKFLATLVVEGPAKLTWQGIKILNPGRLPEHAVSTSLKFFERAFGILFKRGMGKVLQQGLKEIVLVPHHYKRTHSPRSRSDYAGLYHIGKRRITMVVDNIVAGRVSNTLEDFIEVFLHEFGHFVYFEYLTKEARAFFDSGWDIIDAKSQDLDLHKLYRKRVSEFEQGLDKAKWDFKAYYQKLQGIDKVLFGYMLRELGFVSTPKQLRLTEEAKTFAELRRGDFWEDVDTLAGAERLGKLFSQLGIPLSMTWPHELWSIFIEHDPVLWVQEGAGDMVRKWRQDEGEDLLKKVLKGKWSNRLINHGDYISFSELDEFAEANAALKAELAEVKAALNIPTAYGHTNVQEDFAETFYIFVLYPKGSALSKEARWRMGRTLGMSASQGRPVIKVARKKLL